ncbi:MAG: class I SAM-dependent methyltransferase [Phycisphaerae bacterium]|nr:class I SAM-dependent methyltransferase [Phycisphaerae bacterium]
MTTILEHPDGQVEVSDLPGGKRRVTICCEKYSIPEIERSIETAYSVELIQKILDIKGLRYLNDEIRREQDPYYTKICIEKEIFGYLSQKDCENKRILDFGCGAGASGTILARMFPKASIVGVDLDPKLVSLAKLRAEYYGLSHLKFYCSPSGKELPEGLGTFDGVVLSAVFEHLLPDERNVVLRQIWSLLNPGGILFVNQTPYRWFPFEGHTTHLPLINYLPRRIAHYAACRFSNRIGKNETWENLLRRGIRGSTPHEILKILKKTDGKYTPKRLKPIRLGFRDRIDIWYAGYAVSIAHKYPKMRIVQKVLRIGAKVIYSLTGIVFLPTLAMAIRKTPKMK